MTQLRQRKDEIEKLGATLFCVLPMDLYRTRTFQEKTAGPYTTICDPAGRASAIYGVAKQLVVHDEWVNSPSVFVIDKKGVIAYAYVGNSWGDRPSAEAIVEEVKKAAKQ
jgi:peroxiredoxin